VRVGESGFNFLRVRPPSGPVPIGTKRIQEREGGKDLQLLSMILQERAMARENLHVAGGLLLLTGKTVEEGGGKDPELHAEAEAIKDIMGNPP